LEGTRYRVLSPIGRGSSGTVYRAEMIGASGFVRRVALKVLHPALSSSRDLTNRLRDEARLLGLIDHQAVVKSGGLIPVRGGWGVVMDLVEGANLRKLRQLQGVPVGVALDVIIEVASALHTAFHTQESAGGAMLRLTHRDIKPENILITPTGAVKLLDFGMARADFGTRESDTLGPQLGTIWYLAPERLKKQNGPEGDIYALGVVLYELLCGRVFCRSLPQLQRHDVLVEEGLAALEAELPREDLATHQQRALVDYLHRMLCAQPEDRPSAETVWKELSTLRQSIGGESLRDWAHRQVPFVLDSENTLTPDELVGQVFPEEAELYFLPGDASEVTQISLSPPPDPNRSWITVDEALQPEGTAAEAAGDEPPEEPEGFPIIDSPHVPNSPVDMELVAAVRRELLEQEEDRPEPLVAALISIIIVLIVAGVGSYWVSWESGDRAVQSASAAEVVEPSSAPPPGATPPDEAASDEAALVSGAKDGAGGSAADSSGADNPAADSDTSDVDGSADNAAGDAAGDSVGDAVTDLAVGSGRSEDSDGGTAPPVGNPVDASAPLGGPDPGAALTREPGPVDSTTGAATDGGPSGSAGTGVPLVVLSAKLRSAPGLSACFAAHRDSGGVLLETVNITLTVTPGGGVTAVTAGGALAGTPLEGCLASAVGVIRFQPFAGPARTYPFPLTPRW